MKDKIIQMRNDGKSYKQIQKILGCSLGTISYHCGEGQKEKNKKRARFYYSSLLGILKRKKDNFSIINRSRRCNKGKRISLSFSSKKFIKKIEGNPYCYLTGRPIDLWQPKTYQFDHIIPVGKGGSSDLDNLGLACKDANQSKSDLMLNEYLNLCKEVLTYHGYNVTKMEG